MRAPRERRFERRRSRRHERDVGRAERIGRMAVEQRQRQFFEPETVDRRFEAVARRPGRERHQELRIRPHRMERFGGPEHELAVHVELGRATARQQREHGLGEAELQLLARFAPRAQRPPHPPPADDRRT